MSLRAKLQEAYRLERAGAEPITIINLLAPELFEEVNEEFGEEPLNEIELELTFEGYGSDREE